MIPHGTSEDQSRRLVELHTKNTGLENRYQYIDLSVSDRALRHSIDHFGKT